MPTNATASAVPLLPPSEVAPGVGRIVVPLPLGMPDHLNCYVLLDDSVLIDTGMRGSEGALRAGLEHFGIDVERVVLTHGHPDHWGLAGQLCARVLAHPDARGEVSVDHDIDRTLRRALPGREMSPSIRRQLMAWRAFAERPPAIDCIRDGERIGEWEVVATPGHAPGHICLYRAEDGVLIAGDQLLSKIVPSLYICESAKDPIDDLLHSLERVAALDVRLVLPSHGRPLTDAMGRVESLLTYHRGVLARLEQELSARPATTTTLASLLFGTPPGPVAGLIAEMETHTYLEHLRLRSCVSAVGAGLWSAVC